MKVDFLILYEHRERELDNACLLKYHLEKIGYKARIESIYSISQHFIDASVIIVPHLYDDYQVYAFLCKYRKRKCKVINLQYEQVISDKDIQSMYGAPSGSAQNCIIFAWGQSEYNRYVGSRQRVEITGSIAMDFNLEIYTDFFRHKNDLCEEYKLDLNKKILLFISSFGLANADDNYLKAHYPNEYVAMKEFADISKKSKLEIINWLDCYSKNNSDIQIVYRPHPSESEDELLKSTEQKNSNFFIIRDYSIRQWIKCSDILVTWFSTSIVDAYYAKKSCLILRPYQIPEDLDVPFLINAKHICSYEELEENISNTDLNYNELEIGIHKYYANVLGQECIQNVIDKCVTVLKDNTLLYTYTADTKYKKRFTALIKTAARDLLYDVGMIIDFSSLYDFLYENNKLKHDSAMIVQRELFGVKKIMKDNMLRLNRCYERRE